MGRLLAVGYDLVQFTGEDNPWPEVSDRAYRWRLLKQSNVWRPPTDVIETEDTYVVMVEIAGMRGAEFSVTFDQRILTINGARADSSARKAYNQMEIAYGEFATEVELSGQIDASQIEATYSDGFLKIVLPKSQPRSISITD